MAEAFLEQDGQSPPRKVRTADCRNCLILKSLRDAGLSPATIQAICDRMWLNRVRRRQILCTEGNRAAHLFAIRAGKVKLVKVDPTGREHVVSVLKSGDLFGLEAVFAGAYATGAEAMSDCEVCTADGDDLAKLMADVPRVAADLARYLHGRLLETLARQAYLGTPGARAKVAGYLLHELLRKEAKNHVVPHELTLRELGAVLGLTPETVCRTLGALRAERIIDVEPAVIPVRDVAALRRAAGI